jgi:hypothetical protein
LALGQDHHLSGSSHDKSKSQTCSAMKLTVSQSILMVIYQVDHFKGLKRKKNGL